MNKDSFHIDIGSRVTGRDICRYLEEQGIGFTYSGDDLVGIDGFCALKEPKEYSLTWVRKNYHLPVDELNKCSNIILFAEYGTNTEGAEFPVVFVDNVHRTFFRIVEHFFGYLDPGKRTPKIESSAIVETDHIGADVYIGHHTYISKEVCIGDRVTIMHNVTIDGRIEIGDDTFIESGTVIGTCGFGYMINEEGKHELVPHFAGVKIGKNVHIGTNNAINRGCLSDTIIEDDVKTAEFVCIGHNDVIKQGAMITDGVSIGGSTTIGRNVWVAPGVKINNALNVGDNAFLGIGSVVVKDVPDGAMALGYPAKNAKMMRKR